MNKYIKHIDENNDIRQDNIDSIVNSICLTDNIVYYSISIGDNIKKYYKTNDISSDIINKYCNEENSNEYIVLSQSNTYVIIFYNDNVVADRDDTMMICRKYLMNKYNKQTHYNLKELIQLLF